LQVLLCNLNASCPRGVCLNCKHVVYI
jgi:hypothetical protein